MTESDSSDSKMKTLQHNPTTAKEDEEATDEPAQVKFHEVISNDSTKSGAEAYIDYVFKTYRPVSPRSMNCLESINSLFVEPEFLSYFDNVVENSISHSQACDYIRDVVTDVLENLLNRDIGASSPLTSSEKTLLTRIVTKKIFRQQVNTQVMKIIQKASKHLELEIKRSGLKAGSIGDKDFDAGGMKKTWSLENLIGETPVMDSVDPCLEPSKAETQHAIYADLPRYRPAYQPHVDCSDYVALPSLCNLPIYTKSPFPTCLHTHMSPSSWRTTKLGHSTYTVPTFYLSQPMTQVYSKLTKFYNSLK